jgi:hypothetical protein
MPSGLVSVCLGAQPHGGARLLCVLRKEALNAILVTATCFRELDEASFVVLATLPRYGALDENCANATRQLSISSAANQ